MRTKFSEAKDLLADSSRCIALKNREIDELKALVTDHCVMIENLKIQLARFEGSRNQL